MELGELFMIGLFVVLFALQLLFSLKVRPVVLKLLPTVLCVGACVLLFVLAKTAVNWDALGYVLLLVYALISLPVCGLAWIVAGIIHAIKKRAR